MILIEYCVMWCNGNVIMITNAYNNYHYLSIFEFEILSVSDLSEICAVCAPTSINVGRPVEQIVCIQRWNSNHVSVCERNHKPGG